MRKWLILLSALSGTTASGAPAWTWVDANGTVHFSDRPVPGARQVELAGAQFLARGRPRRRGRARPTPDAPGGLPGHRHREPGRPRDALEHRHDAQRAGAVPARSCNRVIATTWCSMGSDATSTRRVSASTLPDVFRGTHTLQVVVIDSAGAELMRSPSRTFHVQQTSVQNPNSAIARPRAGAN